MPKTGAGPVCNIGERLARSTPSIPVRWHALRTGFSGSIGPWQPPRLKRGGGAAERQSWNPLRFRGVGFSHGGCAWFDGEPEAERTTEKRNGNVECPLFL